MSDQKQKAYQITSFRMGVDPETADEKWKPLEHAINEIYNQNADSLNFEDLYRHAYSMIVHKHGEKLYSGLVTTMTARLQEMSKSIEAAEGDSFLQVLNSKWTNHINALQMIRDMLMYMDRTFVVSTHKTPIYELGLNLWKENVIHSSNNQVRLRLTSKLLELIWREREEELIDRTLMRNTIKMLIDLGSVYQDSFEKIFLETSADFYRIESEKLIESCSCGDYLKKAENCHQEEIERVASYLDPKTEAKIANVVEKEMIANHMLRLVHNENSGLVNMLRDDKYEDLIRMCNWFQRVSDGLSTIQDVMASHIRETGQQPVIDTERAKDPLEFVQCLLDEKDKYDKIMSLAFNNDESFQNVLNSSFEFIVNSNPHSPEFLSLFLDDKLRKGLTHGDVLDKVMNQLQYLKQKDEFKKFYEQHLAERLVSGTTVCDDAERSVIAKLQSECGSLFASKLEDIISNARASV